MEAVQVKAIVMFHAPVPKFISRKWELPRKTS